MDEEIVKQIVDEVLSSLEPLDAQGAALLQLLKAKGMVNDEELAPYLEQAGKASNVRWLAARVRVMSLIGSAIRTEKAEKQAVKEEETKSNEGADRPGAESKEEWAEGPTGQNSERKQDSGEKEDSAKKQDSGKNEDEEQHEKPVGVAEESDESKPQSIEQDKQKAA